MNNVTADGLDPIELRLLAASLLACATVLLITPLAIRVANRFQLWDRPHGYKAHKAPTPYLGGAAVIAGFLAGAFALGGEVSQFAPVLAGALGLAAIGAIDDWRMVPPAPRLIAEALAAVGLWATGFGWSVAGSEAVNLGLTIAWVIGLVNALNLMDNIDGAATTVAAISAGGVAALALLAGEPEVAVLAVALLGACAAFLRYNLTGPARIFLGDGGSMPIGFIIAATLMATPAAGGMAWGALVPATLIAGLPIIDTALVIVSRSRRGVAICTGGRDHMTHRLLSDLSSPRHVAAVLALGQALLCGAGLVAFKGGTGTMIAAGFLFGAGALGAVILLESPLEATRVLRAGNRVLAPVRARVDPSAPDASSLAFAPAPPSIGQSLTNSRKEQLDWIQAASPARHGLGVDAPPGERQAGHD
jgi:UDP-GlcNAc:undecaprenyl-phosphate/decaprenyl-phosphate GlcNAc-1-phosphate transferase